MECWLLMEEKKMEGWPLNGTRWNADHQWKQQDGMLGTSRNKKTFHSAHIWSLFSAAQQRDQTTGTMT